MADVVYFDGGISIPFCPPTVNGIYISGSGCCSEFYSAFIGGNQTYNLTYTLPTASGTSGQVLTNDGNGNLSWTTVSGGGGGTGTITGTGTTNYLSKWSSSTALTNSIVLETGSTIDISGALRVTASSGTATAVMGRDANGYVSNLSLGNGLSISGGTLSFTGSTGVSGNFVPYLGATGNTDLGGYGIAGSYFQLSTSTGGTLVPGMFSWNGTDGTADLMLKGGNVTLQIGQEQVARVINETGANLLESQYKVVRVNGSTGTRLKVALALASGDATSVETLGVVTENITLNQEGFVTTSGLVRGINTTGSLQGETWSDGDMLFLSPFVAGGLTNIKPQAPNHLVVMGYVVTAANNGTIYVKVDNGYELDELHNVLISSAATNEILAYDGVTGVWRNRTASSLNLVSGSGVTGIVPSWASSSGLTDSVIFSTGTVVGINTTNPQATLDVRGTMRLTGSTGVSSNLMGRSVDGDISGVVVDGGLSLSGNILSVTGVTYGTGTTNRLLKWSSATGVTDSIILETGSTIDITGALRVTASSGTSTTLMGRDGNGYVSNITTGAGLQLSNGTLFLTGATGTGTTGIVPRWASSSGLTDSVIFSTGTVVGINTTSPAQTLDIRGTMRLTGSTGDSTTIMGRNANGDVSAISIGSGLSLSGNILSSTGGGGGSGTVTGSGTATQVAFWSGATGTTSTALSGSSNLYWDNVNGRLGVGTSSPSSTISINGDFSSGVQPIQVTRTGILSTDAVFSISNGTSQAGQFLPSFTSISNYQSAGETIGGYFNARTTDLSANDIGLVFESRLKTGGTFGSPMYRGWLMSFKGFTTDYIRIAHNGNTVIQSGGTFTNNGYKLDVISFGSTHALRVIAPNASSGTNALLVQNTGSTDLLKVEANGNIAFGTGVTWDNINGRLGIGGVSPSAQFDITNTQTGTYSPTAYNVSICRMARGNNSGIANQFAGFAFQVSSDNFNFNAVAQVHALQETTSSNNTSIIFQLRSSAGYFELMRGNSSGNLGIATTSPSARLHVVGSGTTTGTAMLIQNSGGASNLFAVQNNGQIGVNTATPNTSSIFQIDSTTLGFLPPRMSTTQKTGIASPAQGLVVYDTTMQALSAYNGSNWATVGGGEQMFTITGSTATINFNAGNIADITLATSTTLTLTGGTFGTFIIKLTQDATGGRVVSWPSNVRWSGGIPPSLTTTGGKVDVISLIFDGTNYYGTYALNF